MSITRLYTGADGRLHVTLAEDLTGQGHTTRVVGNERRLTATIHLGD